MSIFETLTEKTKRNFPGYKFSWEIFTDIILENVATKPYWLDIGAGKNILIKEQPGANFSVGLDIIKENGLYNDHNTGAYVIANSSSLPFKDNSFEFITSRYTFEHLRQPQKTLAEIHRVLKTDGSFAMQTTNKNSPLILLSRLVPFKIKRVLIRKFFKNAPSDTFETYYEMNTPAAIKSENGSLRLEKLILIEDLLCQSRFLYIGSMLIFRFMRFFHLEKYSNNMIAIYRKNGN